jgi:hypothetical protein
VKFRFADSSTIIENGDQLRTGESVTASLKTVSNASILLGERSRIRLETTSKKNTQLTSVVLYSGSCLLRTPDENEKETVYNIQTLTAVIELRTGSSVAILVDTMAASTSVWVTCGNPLLRSVTPKKSISLKAGHHLFVDNGVPLPQPKELNEINLSNDLEWVNSIEQGALKKEFDRSRKADERKRAILALRLEGDIVFYKFRDMSHYMGVWDISTSLAYAGYNMLLKNDLPVKFVNIDQDSVLPDTIAKKAGVIVSGTIHNFEFRKEDAFLIFNCEIGYQLISPTNKRILTEFRHIASDKIKETSGNTYKEITSLPFDIQNPSFAQTIVGSNLKTVILELNKKLRDTFGL